MTDRLPKKDGKYRIAWLPGDGVGVDVLDATKIVLDKLNLNAEYIHGDIGWEFWCKEGDAFPARTIELLKNVDAAMFGAITSKPVKTAEAELIPELRGTGLTYRSPIVRMRQIFDLYHLPATLQGLSGQPPELQGEHRPRGLPREHRGPVRGGRVQPGAAECGCRPGPGNRSPSPLSRICPETSTPFPARVNTRKGSERIVRAAFEFARKFGRKKVTVVHKANVVRATDGLFLEIARQVAKDYPEIQMDDANVDAICMWLLKNPLNYDVLVAPNLYGDIISDLCAQMVGGLGFGCSGNIGDKLAVFEPTHGSAPKYAGQYKVNPIATILAAKMMLDWLGETEKGAAVEAAVAAVIKEGKVRTYDMGGSNTTLEMGQAVAAKL